MAQGFGLMEHLGRRLNDGIKWARWNLSPQRPPTPFLFLLLAATTAERCDGCKRQGNAGLQHHAGARPSLQAVAVLRGG